MVNKACDFDDCDNGTDRSEAGDSMHTGFTGHALMVVVAAESKIKEKTKWEKAVDLTTMYLMPLLAGTGFMIYVKATCKGLEPLAMDRNN